MYSNVLGSWVWNSNTLEIESSCEMFPRRMESLQNLRVVLGFHPFETLFNGEIEPESSCSFGRNYPKKFTVTFREAISHES